MKTLTFFGPKYGTQVSLLSPNVVSKLSRFPLTSFARKPTKPVCVKTTDCDLVESQRTFNKFPRSDWGDHFLRLPFNVSVSSLHTYIYRIGAGDIILTSWILIGYGYAYNRDERTKVYNKEDAYVFTRRGGDKGENSYNIFAGCTWYGIPLRG